MTGILYSTFFFIMKVEQRRMQDAKSGLQTAIILEGVINRKVSNFQLLCSCE